MQNYKVLYNYHVLIYVVVKLII